MKELQNAYGNGIKGSFKPKYFWKTVRVFFFQGAHIHECLKGLIFSQLLSLACSTPLSFPPEASLKGDWEGNSSPSLWKQSHLTDLLAHLRHTQVQSPELAGSKVLAERRLLLGNQDAAIPLTCSFSLSPTHKSLKVISADLWMEYAAGILN